LPPKVTQDSYVLPCFALFGSLAHAAGLMPDG
jgi:hypothetical protein